MDTNEQLSALFAAAIEQQETAKATINDLVEERAKLLATINSIKDAARSLQTAAGDAASKAVEESLGKAPNAATGALKTATEALNDAADKVRNAGAWISWKFALVFVLAGVAAVPVDGEAVVGIPPALAYRPKPDDRRHRRGQPYPLHVALLFGGPLPAARA